MSDEKEVGAARRSNPVHPHGRFWFSRETERRFYFFLTAIMLAIGLLHKIGVI